MIFPRYVPLEVKQRLARVRVRELRQYELALQASVMGAFARERDLLAKAVVGIHHDMVDFVVGNVLDQTRQKWAALLRMQLRAVAESVASPMLEPIPERVSPKRDKSVLYPYGDRKDANVRLRYRFTMESFLEDQLEESLVRISNTTRRRITKRLKEAARSAQLERVVTIKLPEAVTTGYAAWSKARATTISRTAVNRTANYAQRAAARSLRLPNMWKQWIATNDHRTRDGHAAVNGTSVPMEAKFEVPYPSGVDLMDGPHDRSASLANKINCRCTLVYTSEAER